MKVIRYIDSWFESGDVKYESGKDYPVSDETAAHAARGIAQEIEVADEVAEPVKPKKSKAE